MTHAADCDQAPHAQTNKAVSAPRRDMNTDHSVLAVLREGLLRPSSCEFTSDQNRGLGTKLTHV